MKGLIGRKLGMTQVFLPDGRVLPVTVLEAGPNVVVQAKAKAGKDGYTALKLGYGAAHKHEKEGTEPRWRLNRPRVGVFLKAGIETPRLHVREFRLADDSELGGAQPGQELNVADLFAKGQFVDVIGTSKGRGFQGVMRRHNFKGSKQKTHGTHEYFRHPGSVGASAWPSRVFPGSRGGGHMGNARVTIQSLHVVDVDAEKNLMLVKGAVPGPNGGLVMIQRSVKKRNATKAL